MTRQKRNGAYYTPEFLSEFMVQYCASNFTIDKHLNVLEPSVGDGSFARAFNKAKFPTSIKSFSFTGVDKIKGELKKAQEIAIANRRKSTRYNFVRKDFLQYQKSINRKFNLIVGNPPYIKKTLLSKTQISLCEQIHKSANLPITTVKNIWPSFVLRSGQLLKDNGVMALVLPADLLQVKYSDELRTYLTRTFERVEIFTFDDLLFECKGQDTVLLFAFKRHELPGLYYTHIAEVGQLTSGNFHLTQKHALVSTDTKWSHHALDNDDVIFIHSLGSQWRKISDYCESKPGIVTAANDFFIISDEIANRYRLERYCKPIIQKGSFVNGSVTFNGQDYQNLRDSGMPCKVLCFSDHGANNLPDRVTEYLNIGIGLEIPDRYKCRKRNNWFVVPNIATPSQGFFFKRSHFYPKLLKNEAEVWVTDSAYKIEMRSGFEINHLVYSFYNSLSLVFSEITGRYYGGGVLELTPSEFKKIPIPNIQVSDQDFLAFTNDFEAKTSIHDILLQNDFPILNESLGLNREEILRVQRIYQRLVDKRLRKKGL